jgi:hypothetical protein
VKIPLKARQRSESRAILIVPRHLNLEGTNGLTGLGIEPMVGRKKSEAVFFFSSFSFGQAKEKDRVNTLLING